MKIGIIHTVKSYGGSVISLIDMLTMLRHDHEVTVYISRYSDKRAVSAVAAIGVRTVLYEKEPVLFTHYSGFNSVLRLGFWHGLTNWIHNRYWIMLLTGNKEEAVLLNSSALSLFGAMLRRHTRLKTVCYVRETHNPLLRGLLDRYMRKLLSRQDAVIFLSGSERRHFALPNDNYVIADVLNPALFPPRIGKAKARGELGLNMDGCYILFMGGFSRLKGTTVILDAMARLRTKDAVLLLLGNTESGNAEFDMQCTKAVKEAANVDVFGLRRDVSLFYSAADILVFPSTRDHQARPLMEAGYYGIPAVISDFEGTREYITDGYNGRSFPPCNAQTLANILDALCTDRMAREVMGRNNGIMTQQLHSIENGKKIFKTVFNSFK